MKYFLRITFLLFFSVSFAQLTVTNDAFIFVDGDGFTPGANIAPLYVEDEINLTGTDSNIYLRNEAQLLQGNSTVTSTNSGTGKLSVYQTGTVNQWSYNYWCSPVGNNSAIAGNEPARVELLNDVTGLTTSIPAAFTLGFDGSASPLTISSKWLNTYQMSSLYIDWVHVANTGNILPGLGFTMKGNGTGTTGSQLYDFRGKPNNGTITNVTSPADFTLVGNPYPSAIDSRDFLYDPDNINEIEGTLYYWEQDGTVMSHVLENYRGGYHEFTINPAGTVTSSTPAQFGSYGSDGTGPLFIGLPEFGGKLALRYIPIGQGFMVEGKATGSITNTVSVKNSHRVFEKEGSNSYFFRSSATDNDTNFSTNAGIQYQENGLSIVPADYKRFRINVDFTVTEGQFTRQLLLNFHDTATFGHDRGLELHRSENLSSDAYFEQENDIFSGLAYPFTEALTIPISIDIEQQQPLRFRIFDIQNFDESQSIYIHDTENDTYVDLRNQDYELNIDAGNYTDRFEIVFTTQALSIDELDVASLTIRQNNNANELTVLNPNGLDIKTITLYDVAGKRVLNTEINTVSDAYSLSTSALSNGVYVVNLSSNASTTVKSQKIIVKN